ncbi:MAG: T9SS type A sorting domain-containing protein [Psychroflexus sp.]
MKRLFFFLSLILSVCVFAQENTFSKEWTTYANNPPASFNHDINSAIIVDNNDNVYITKSNSNVNGNVILGSLSKFSPEGELLWTTEPYGMTNGLAIDQNGDIIISGYTHLLSGIATNGAFQENFGGGNKDVFLMKFSPEGNRIWGTYFGGTGDENPFGSQYYMGLEITPNNNIIWTSRMESSQIGTTGTFQPQIEGAEYAISKFSNDGQRIWTTYYGTGEVSSHNIAGLKVDESGIYVTGKVENNDVSNTYFDTSGNYNFESQSEEIYVSKFDLTGNRIWSRYIQGNGQSFATRYALALKDNYIYLTFKTTSTDFGTEGTTFPNIADGNNPGVLIKLDLDGNINWSTYLPDNYYSHNLNIPNVYTNDSDGIYIKGSTIAVDDGILGMYSPEINGVLKFYVMKFNDEGEMIWGNYFDDTSNQEVGNPGLAFYSDGLYLTGTTEGTQSISTQGVFQEEPNENNYSHFISKYTAKEISIIDFNSDKIIAYPNPTSSLLNLQLNDGVDFPVKAYIYNTTGQLIKSKNIHQTRSTFDLKLLNQGLYFLQLKSQRKVVTKKIIIE